MKKFLKSLRKFNFILILLSLVLSQIALSEPGKKFLILGDSISAGYGVGHDKKWTSILQRKLDSSGKNLRIINASVNGCLLYTSDAADE